MNPSKPAPPAVSRARLGSLARIRTAWLARGTVAVAAVGLLLRLAPDVREKPLFEDEAVAGLISARPLDEVLETTVVDRGGAPLHFVVTHLAFAVDASPTTLRWLSVLFSLATVAVCYDLGRRLAGEFGGATAAVVAATSGMLAVYGSFGRMYALFAFAAALASDLFVRALQVPSARNAALAAAGAWFLPATHPYGGIFVAVEAVVALALWRGSPLRPALPALAIAIAMLPFALVDLRLVDRFSLDVTAGDAPGAEMTLASPADAWRQLSLAIQGFAGGDGLALVLFVVLAAVGAVALRRRERAFVPLVALALVVPPAVSLVLATPDETSVSPRHLIFALPGWAALVGTGAARLLREAGPARRIVALGALALVAGLSPVTVPDPRELGAELTGERGDLERPSAWLRANVGRGDVLFPYSSVFVAGLPETGEAVSLPRAQPEQVVRALEHAPIPARTVVVAIPSGDTRFATDQLTSRLGRAFEVHAFPRWVLVQATGPFRDRGSVIAAAVRALVAGRDAAVRPPESLAGYLRLSTNVLCEALRSFGRRCAASAAS